MTRLVLILLSCLAILGNAKTSKKRVLIIHEDDIKESHSTFFKDLQANGFSLTFKDVSDKSISLEKWGAYSYDNLILFTPTSRTFGKKLGPKEIVDYIDSGRNLILVGGSQMSKAVFDVALDCGIDFEAIGSQVLDHSYFAKSAGDINHKLIVVEQTEVVSKLFNSRKTAAESRPLIYSGIGHSVAPDNDRVVVAVTGNPTTYSTELTDDLKDEERLIGMDIALVSLMQTSNNARVSVVGSLDFFSDDYFNRQFTPTKNHLTTESVISGNREFCKDLTLWTFQDIGVLRVNSVRHYNADTGESPDMYTVKDRIHLVKDRIHFEMNIQEYVVDKWAPYKADDIQLEYTMLDPYIRTSLVDRGNGTFSVDLRAPDVYGVFKFIVKYSRPGYSNIDITEMAPIRPYKHNEFERFLLAAYPYYISLLSMMVGFWLFGIVHLS